MWQGAALLLIGIVIGWLGCMYAPEKKAAKGASRPYDKYRNKDGLYSRKAVRESG